MAWFTKHRLSSQQADLERKALAASVEEITAEGELLDEAWDEEVPAGKTAIVPPLLRLQSRPWPVVRVNVTKRAHMEQEQEPHPAESFTEPHLPAQPKRLGRSTKVHLQAVRPGQEAEPITERVPVLETVAKEGPPPTGDALVQRAALSETAQAVDPVQPDSSPQAFVGSGIIEQGQDEVTITSSQISAQSVVVVMLAGNPGPVVVQYISLHPPTGFTCHLSAPVVAQTPFNYLIWPR